MARHTRAAPNGLLALIHGSAGFACLTSGILLAGPACGQLIMEPLEPKDINTMWVYALFGSATVCMGVGLLTLITEKAMAIVHLISLMTAVVLIAACITAFPLVW